MSQKNLFASSVDPVLRIPAIFEHFVCKRARLEPGLKSPEPPFFQRQSAKRLSVMLSQLRDEPFQCLATKTRVDVAPESILSSEDGQCAKVVDESHDMVKKKNGSFMFDMAESLRFAIEVAHFCSIPRSCRGRVILETVFGGLRFKLPSMVPLKGLISGLFDVRLVGRPWGSQRQWGRGAHDGRVDRSSECHRENVGSY